MQEIIDSLINEDVSAFEQSIKKEISNRIYSKIQEMKEIVARSMFNSCVQTPEQIEEQILKLEPRKSSVSYPTVSELASVVGLEEEYGDSFQMICEEEDEEIPQEVLDQVSKSDLDKYKVAAKKMILAIKLKNFDFEDEDGKLEKAFFNNMIRMKTQTGNFEKEDSE